MTACREQIVAAAATALGAIAGIAGLAVERERNVDTPVTDAELPRLVLYEGGEAPNDVLTGERGWTLTLDVEGYVKAATPTAAAQAAAALRAKVQAALFGDVTLGGLARDLRAAAEPAPQRLALECADPAVGFVLGFTVDYATRESDFETFS